MHKVSSNLRRLKVMSNDKELYELGDVSPKLFFTEEELKSHGIVACNFSPKMYEVDWDKVGLEEMKASCR